VRIQGFTFQPAEVRIRAGGTVTWVNEDPATHDATGDSWTTGPLPASASATVTFRTPGVYTYRCTIHPSMTGTIYVDP
jgi:plastocyanin